MSEWWLPNSNNLDEVRAYQERLFTTVFGTADPKITDKKAPQSGHGYVSGPSATS